MKPYVVCHMMPSVDGRLRTERWDVPESGHNEYERTADSFKADAWICGRVTMEEFANGQWRRSRGRATRVPRVDFVAPGRKTKRFAVALDAHGKLAWKNDKIEGDSLIAVLGEDVPSAYLEFLRGKGISYVFGGGKGSDLNLKRVLEKLSRLFGIKTIMLEGGGETNGSFLRAGLIDELSLLLTPVADGKPGEPALFDIERYAPKKAAAKLRLKSVRRAAADMLWIKYRVQRNGR